MTREVDRAVGDPLGRDGGRDRPRREKIILSAKVTRRADLIAVYTELATPPTTRCIWAHQAGMGSKGIVASSAAMGILCRQGIGDTIRISLTPEPNGDRTRECRCRKNCCRHGLFAVRADRRRMSGAAHHLHPPCSRNLPRSNQAETLRKNMPVWREKYPGVENLKVAVMGCIVNGPGESKHADIGISLPAPGRRRPRPLRRRQEGATLRGPLDRGGFREDGRRLYRATVRSRQGSGGVGGHAAFPQGNAGSDLRHRLLDGRRADPPQSARQRLIDRICTLSRLTPDQ